MRVVRFLFSKFFICITFIAALTAAIIFLCVYIHSLLPAAAAVALAYALSLSAAIALLSGESPAEFKCGWLTAIVALPVAGAALYFLSLLCRGRCDNPPVKIPPCGCDGWEYFSDGAQYLDRLIALVSVARRNVYLEYYIISRGHIWGALLSELEKAVDRGVEVKIIYDALGSALKAPKKDFKRLAKKGAQIKIFNRLLPLPLSRLNFRDHRKIAVIDDGAVFLGGVNIGDEYANLTFPHGHWKDGGALLYGQVAEVFSRLFLSSFGQADTDDNQTACPPQNVERPKSKAEVLPVADDPDRLGSACEDLLAAHVYGAEKRVFIFTPYLCMGEKLEDALAFASRRGADVKIIIPAVPDKKLTYAITRSYCARLSDCGVGIYEYTPGFMHFKGVVCDDRALIGSYNLDFRSMRLNYENGVWCDGSLAQEMANDFVSCLAVSKQFSEGKVRAGKKLIRTLLRLFAPLA